MIDNSNRITKMRELLVAKLTPSHLEIIDDSLHHMGHTGATLGAGHFTVIISANCFQGKNRIACHRMVYDALDEMMGPDIHAMSIKVKG